MLEFQLNNVLLTNVKSNEYKGKTGGQYKFLYEGDNFTLYGDLDSSLLSVDLKQPKSGTLWVTLRTYNGLLKVRFVRFVVAQ